MKKSVLLVLLLGFSFSFSQENYKYVIIPAQFSFFDEINKYGLNELTKAFFQSEGFEVYYDNDKFPDELFKNRCLALYANPIENNTMFVTKIQFEIKDCNNKVLVTSDIAASREKQFKTAYTITFRQALSSLKSKLNYKIEKNDEVLVTQKEVIEVIPDSKNTIIDVSQLRAVATETGYKLVSYTDNVVIVLYNTSLEGIFIANGESYKKGVFLKKNNNWFFEYDFEGKVYSEKIEVKF